jgi:exonuclease SbcD
VWVAYDYTGRVVETKRGPVYVASAPYPIRARLLERANTAGMTIAQTDELLQTELTRILDHLAQEADQQDMPRLLTAHFTVGGAVVGSERGIMLGRDVAVPKSILADPRWDYVALGHIHKHQNLTAGRIDAPPVVYSGSIERIDFGEEGDPKGFCMVELNRDETTWEFIRLDARPFVTLKADLRRSLNPTQDALNLVESHNLRQAVVRMFLQFTPESEARFNEFAVREALKRSGVFHFAALRKEIDQPARARLGASPEGLTPDQLLERYLISKEVQPERREELMETANSIFESESNASV